MSENATIDPIVGRIGDLALERQSRELLDVALRMAEANGFKRGMDKFDTMLRTPKP